jgi:hypothetical protein
LAAIIADDSKEDMILLLLCWVVNDSAVWMAVVSRVALSVKVDSPLKYDLRP